MLNLFQFVNLLYMKYPVMFWHMYQMWLFLGPCKKNIILQNMLWGTVKLALNSFPKTVSLKTRFLFFLAYLCQFLIVFDHYFGDSKLENFCKGYTTCNNNILCQRSYRSEIILCHDCSNFYYIFLNATVNACALWFWILFNFLVHEINFRFFPCK